MSNRPFTAKMTEAVEQGRPYGLLAEIEHPSGTARYWTGIGTLQYNGLVWTGVGRLGSVSPVKHSSDIAIQDIVFSLTGVNPSDAAELLDDVRNRKGRVWWAFFDDKNQVIPDPYQLIDAELDYQAMPVGDDGTVTIQITAHSGFYTLERGVDEAWTPENQALNFPGDSGLDMIPGLQNQDIQWTPV